MIISHSLINFSYKTSLWFFDLPKYYHDQNKVTYVAQAIFVGLGKSTLACIAVTVSAPFFLSLLNVSNIINEASEIKMDINYYDRGQSKVAHVARTIFLRGNALIITCCTIIV